MISQIFFYSIVIKQIIRIAQLSEVYSKRHFPLSHPPVTLLPYNRDESSHPHPFLFPRTLWTGFFLLNEIFFTFLCLHIPRGNCALVEHIFLAFYFLNPQTPFPLKPFPQTHFPIFPSYTPVPILQHPQFPPRPYFFNGFSCRC